MSTQFFMKVADIDGSSTAVSFEKQISVGNVSVTTSDFAGGGNPPFVMTMDVENAPTAKLALSVLNGTVRPSVDVAGVAIDAAGDSLERVVNFTAQDTIFTQLSVTARNGTISHGLELTAVKAQWDNADADSVVTFDHETETATENTSLDDNPLGYGADVGAAPTSGLRFFMKVTEGGDTRWLEIEGFDFAMSRPVLDVGGQQHGHANASFTELNVTRFADDASMQFAHLADTMAAKGQVDIQVFQDVNGGTGQKWQMVSSMTFANTGQLVGNSVRPFVSGVNEADSIDGRATETVSFGFTQFIQVDYAAGNTLGTDGLPKIEKYADVEWDLALGKLGASADALDPAPVNASTGQLPPLLPPEQQVEHAGIEYTLTIVAGGDTLTFDLGHYDLDIQARELSFALANDADTLLLKAFQGLGEGHGVTIEARDDNGVLISQVALSNADLLAMQVDWTEASASKKFVYSFADHDASFDWEWLNADETMSSASLAHGTDTLRLGGPLPMGGGAGIPTDGGPGQLAQHAFMQISANGQTAWLPIEDFDFGFYSDDPSDYATLSINRLYDDAGALISQLAASGSSSPGGFVTIKIVVFDDVDVDGPDLLWVPVAQYEFGRARIVSDEMSAGGENENFATQKLTIEFQQFAEQHNTSDPGDYDPAERSGYRIDLQPAVPVATNWTSAPPTVPVDQETGELIDGSQVGFDPLVELSPGSGLQIFIKISLEGSLIDSGDGVLDVAYLGQNTYFAVNTFTFQPGAYGEPAQAFLTLGDSQNWVELLRRMHVTSTADFEIEIVAIDHPGGVVGKQIWKLATDDASISMSTEGASPFKAFTVTLAPEPGQTFTYQVLESSDGHGPGAAVTSTFTRTGDGYDASGLAFNTPGVQQGFGNAWLHPGNTNGTSSGDYTIVLRLPDGEFFEITDFSYNRESYLKGPALEDWRGQINFATALNSNANLFAYYAATGTVLDQIEVEVWLAGERYFGLADYTFKDAKFVTQTVSFGENPMAVLSLTFDGYTMAAAKADPGTGEIDPDGWNYYDSGAPLVRYDELSEQDQPVFTGIEDPVLVESGGSFARSAPAFMASFVGATTYISVQDAADAANPGDIVHVRNDLARDLDIVVHVEGLTFDIAEGLALKLTLGATIPGGVPIEDVTITGLGAATIVGNDVANTITGGDGNDIINGGLGNDTIHGGGGNDIITDGLGQNSQGADNINGGEGDDTIIVTWADPGDVYDGGEGDNDTLDLSGDNSGYSVLLGGTFSEWGATFSNFEHLNGNQGIDTVTGSSGANRIFGNGGNDQLNGMGGDDALNGGTGTDVLHGGDNDDTLTDADTDPVSIDQLFGDAGDDKIVVYGPVAGEVFDGGADRDLLDLSHATVPFAGANAINLGAANFIAYGATFSNFEDVTGSNGADEIIGSSGVNAINGGGGDDVINGGDGDDVIDGGAGDDILTDGVASALNTYGSDQLLGGADNDTIRVNLAGFGEIFDGGEGIDTLDVSGEIDGYFMTLGVAEYSYFDASFRNFENFIGTSFHDVVTGSEGANLVDGGAGSDEINTLGGADEIIDSDNDHDTINAGAGNDVVRVRSQAAGAYDGGADLDLLDLSARTAGFTGTGKINLSLPSFTNLGSTFANFENVLGTTRGDQITGSIGANQIDGNTGTDSIDAGDGNDIIWDKDTDKDTIRGGAGDDRIIVRTVGTDVYDGGTGVDTLDLSHSDMQQYMGGNAVRLTGTFYFNGTASFKGFENVIGTMYTDDIFGSAVANEIDGGDGYDIVRAGNGSDTLRDMDGSADELYGDTGNDTFIVTAIAGPSIYDGGAGNDLLDLSALTSGFGIDQQLDLRGTGAVTFISFERVIATGLADWIIGTDLAEEINGGGGSDTITGNGGYDVLIGGAAGDALFGGLGFDTASYITAAAGVTANLTDSLQNLGDALGDTYDSIENLTGSGFDDVLVGSSVANTILGGAGDDVITGGARSDIMNGGTGADTFAYNANNDSFANINHDIIQGWETIDKIDLTNLDASNVAGLQHFTFLGEGDNSLTMATGTLKYYRENGNTYIVANLNADAAVDFQIELIGNKYLTSDNFIGLQRAVLTGDSNADTLLGTGGDDILVGGGGVDTLRGGAGADILNGGVRGDILSGDAGVDRFIYAAVGDSAPSANVDTINGWDSTDIIDLGDVDAHNTAGVQHFVFLGLTANPATIARGDLQFYHEGGNTIVIGGYDLDAPPEFQIQITGIHNLTAANFELI